MFRSVVSVLMLVQATLMLGCGGPSLPKPKSQEPTFPVTGIVHVDGNPAAGISTK
jgi:hypothetical protein